MVRSSHRCFRGTQTRPPSPRADSRHQTQLVFAGNRSRVNLNELAIGILRALLVTGRNRTAGTNHRVGRLAINQSRAAGRHDHSVGRKGLELERLQVHRDQSAANLMVVEHERHHLPVFILS